MYDHQCIYAKSELEREESRGTGYQGNSYLCDTTRTNWLDMQEKILILDFGSQTTQLIGRRLRELNTYCEIVPYNKLPQDLTGIAGIILSGSPYSIYNSRREIGRASCRERV